LTGMVQTVTGEITPDNLGFVLPHEHIFSDSYEISLNSQSVLLDRRVARQELLRYREAGGTTLVDQTVYGLGGNWEAVREVAEETGVQVIAGTGFYWEQFHPSWLRDMTERDIVELLVSDLTKGFQGTGIQAGILGEIASNHRLISAAEERVFRACAAAQREVPVPIATHALFNRIGMEQARLLESVGANLDKVAIGHCDTAPDVDYHEELLRLGVYVGYDSIGQLDKQTDEERADAVMQLVQRGWSKRILLSSDVCKRQQMHAYGGPGYDHVITNFLPLLRERGADDQLIDTLTRGNPRRLFTFD
jgi:predicted metal-dependent phosphotriesterase family hydrolase